jgi:CDGSH-type Zn-finger protein
VYVAAQGQPSQEQRSVHVNSITSLDDLRAHLQGAIQLEHATLPPYMCALYSIMPGTNQESVDVITSVVVEEMLHMTLAANLLNAVGGTPVLDDPDFIVEYPAFLPYSNDVVEVPLTRFSPAAVQTFLAIERPEGDDAGSQSDRFETIGQFYRALEEGFNYLCESLGEAEVFCGDPSRQITPVGFRWGGGGRVIAVRDLASALSAIDEIEEQGEGLKHAEVWDGDRDMFHPSRDEVAHYYRFRQIEQGRHYQRGDTPQSGPTGDEFDVDWNAVTPMRENPRTRDLAQGDPVRGAMESFNQQYSDLLRRLNFVFNGRPDDLDGCVAAMMGLRDELRELIRMPWNDGTTTAGPSFEWCRARGDDSNEDEPAITVRANGPYEVRGRVPVTRKSPIYSEYGEPLTWRRDDRLETSSSCLLCRCGRSSNKPYCDGTHRRIGFDGTEAAHDQRSDERRTRLEGTNVKMTDDSTLCIHAGFCSNRQSSVWDMVERTEDTGVRALLIHMVEHCPSGRLAFETGDGPIEPDLPSAIGVVKDGPYWVTGEIQVTLSTGQVLETRNRVTLCRCGQSANKPLCDGSHKQNGFRDG